MKHHGNKLTAAAVRAAAKPGLYGDGHGLYLQVSMFETKAWVFRYMINGAPRKLGLGPLHTVSLAEARAEALEARKLVRKGIDPIEHKKAPTGPETARGGQGDQFQAKRRPVRRGQPGGLEKCEACRSVVRDVQ